MDEVRPVDRVAPVDPVDEQAPIESLSELLVPPPRAQEEYRATEATRIQNAMIAIRRRMLQNTVDAYGRISQRKIETQDQLARTRQAFDEELEQLRQDYAEVINDHQGRLRAALLTRPQKLPSTDLQTHSLNILERRVTQFIAVQERRFSLLEQKFTLQTRIAEAWWDLLSRIRLWLVNLKLKPASYERAQQIYARLEELTGEEVNIESFVDFDHYIRQLPDEIDATAQLNEIRGLLKQLKLIERRLGKAPPPAHLQRIANQLIEDLGKPTYTLTLSEAKMLHDQTSRQLSWGSSHIHQAMAKPIFWTPIERYALVTSKRGEEYIQVTRNEPLSPLPSGLRKSQPNTPANMWKVTTYILGEEGTEHTFYRGGVFGSWHAATQALSHMEGDVRSHGLLTPSSLKGAPDRKLMQRHAESLQGRAVVSTVGSNILATQYKLSHHSAILDYNDRAIATLNEDLKNFIQRNPGRMARAATELAWILHNMWATNAYAEDQSYQFAAYWTALDIFMGKTTYIHCMSGKDRTGEVVAVALAILAEVEMNLIEEADDTYLKPPHFEPKRLTALHRLAIGTLGIPTQHSLPLRHPIYAPALDFEPKGDTERDDDNYWAQIREAQRRTKNRRQALLGSGGLAIVQRNTGFAGFKTRPPKSHRSKRHAIYAAKAHKEERDDYKLFRPLGKVRA